MIVRDTLGHQYTIEQFNRLDYIPVGAEFYSLILSGEQGLMKLPKNLVVRDQLVLTGTQVTELPSDLKTEQLVLVKSEVKTLPDNLSVGNLNMVNSKVETIGQGITVKRHLYLSSTKMLNHPISCKSCVLSVFDKEITEFDLTNVNMQELILDRHEGRIVITNAKAESCTLNHAVDVMLDQSEVDQIIFQDRGSKKRENSTLSILPGVKSGSLAVKEVVTPLDVEIDRAQIGYVHIYGQEPSYGQRRSAVRLTKVVLDGDIMIGKYGQFETPDILPNVGVLCGDLYVYKGFEVPPLFCCLGRLYTR